MSRNENTTEDNNKANNNDSMIPLYNHNKNERELPATNANLYPQKNTTKSVKAFSFGQTVLAHKTAIKSWRY